MVGMTSRVKLDHVPIRTVQVEDCAKIEQFMDALAELTPARTAVLADHLGWSHAATGGVLTVARRLGLVVPAARGRWALG